MASKFELYRALNTLYHQLDAMVRGWNTDQTPHDRVYSGDHFAMLANAVSVQMPAESGEVYRLFMQSPIAKYEQMLRRGRASGITGMATNIKHFALQTKMKFMLGQAVAQAKKDYDSSKNKKILLGTGLAIGGVFALSRYFGGKKKRKR